MVGYDMFSERRGVIIMLAQFVIGFVFAVGDGILSGLQHFIPDMGVGIIAILAAFLIYGNEAVLSEENSRKGLMIARALTGLWMIWMVVRFAIAKS